MGQSREGATPVSTGTQFGFPPEADLRERFKYNSFIWDVIPK